MQKNQYSNSVKVILFAVYSLIMLYLLLWRNKAAIPENYYWQWIRTSLNLVPFRTVGEFITTMSKSSNSYLIQHSFVNLAGNVVLFIPLGFFLPWVFEKCSTYRKTILYSGLTIVLIEIAQLFSLRGSCDIDDLILNLVGVSLGYFVFKLIIKRFNAKKG